MNNDSSPERCTSEARPQTQSPAADGQGQVEGIFVSGPDVTGRGDSERDAERLASLGMISATLAHELAQPLSTARLALQSAAAELAKLDCPDVVKQDLQAGAAACARMNEMAHRLRDLARGPETTQKVDVHIPLVAERTFRLLEHSAREAKMTLRTESLEALPTLRMRENELDQLFFALVRNAVQAADGRKDRQLRITGALQGDLIVLRFQDDCGGIDPVHLPRIFEPFFTTKPPGQGMGLGLCIARRTACRRGGRISVENHAGQGATFTVALPLLPRPAPGGQYVP
jgi:two-component system C4-dicarboxylate transport sensor histidine kinase DctB